MAAPRRAGESRSGDARGESRAEESTEPDEGRWAPAEPARCGDVGWLAGARGVEARDEPEG